MGAPNRITINLNKVLGIGISLDNFPYKYNISIYLPFISINIGLGKPYTE
jgi:hypothetical protein